MKNFGPLVWTLSILICRIFIVWCIGTVFTIGKKDMKVQKGHICSLKEHIIYASFDEGGVLFNLEDRVTHELNLTGAGVLDLLDGRRDLQDLVRAYSLKCGQSEDVIKNDIIDFLQDLMERGWVYVR